MGGIDYISARSGNSAAGIPAGTGLVGETISAFELWGPELGPEGWVVATALRLGLSGYTYGQDMIHAMGTN